MVRAFIAVTLPASVRAELAERVRTLQLPRPCVRVVEEENYHITLKFLGNVQEGQLQEVDAALQEIVRQFPILSLQLALGGTFPDRPEARVLWLGVKGDISSMTHMALRIDQRLQEVGFPAEKRKPHLHITLGRVGKEEILPIPLWHAIKALQVDLPRIPVKEICLMRSVLGNGGPTYSVLKSYALTGSPRK